MEINNTEAKNLVTVSDDLDAFPIFSASVIVVAVYSNFMTLDFFARTSLLVM